MNPDRTVLLVGTTDETVRKAKKLGLSVLLLQHPSKVTDEQQGLADLIHVVDYMDWAVVEPLVLRLHRSPGFAVAMSLTEAGLEMAGRVNDLLALGGTGHEVVRRIRDKWEMRRYLSEHDPAALGAAPLCDQPGLEAFGARHGYPFIVKPTNATASFGVFRLDGPQDADPVWAQVRRLTGTRTGRGSMPFAIQDFLMEEYVDGPELSVESFSFAGRHVIVTITQKFVGSINFTELGHALPAPLEPAVQNDVREAVIRFLDLVGIEDGVCHTEVRIGARGPVVIESHNRIAGDGIPALVEGAYDIDLTTYALGWPFGLVPELPDAPRARGGASTRFLVGRPGRVESIEGVEDALAQDGVLGVHLTVKPGDTVRSLHDNWDRLGMIMASGPDAVAASRRAARIAQDMIKIRIVADDGTVHLAHVADIDHVEIATDAS